MSGIVDSDDWATGDLAIVSADGVRFRVASERLYAASDAFRDLSAVKPYASPPSPDCKPGEIHLSDARVESAAGLSRLFSLLYHGDLGRTAESDLPLARSLSSLILLLQKYAATPWLRIALALVRERTAAGSLDPVPAFIAGAVADDLETCWFVLNHARVESCGDPCVSVEGAVGQGADGVPCLNPAGMSWALWELIPREYAWALSRAWVGQDFDCAGVMGEVAGEFWGLMVALKTAVDRLQR